MFRKSYWLVGLLATFLVVSMASAAQNEAQSASQSGPKEKLISITTFDVGAANYVELSVVGDAIFKQSGVRFRLVPIGSTVGRATLLRNKKVGYWQTCSGHYPSFEGLDDFATATWGPMPIRMIWVSNRKANFSPATTQESGINTLADIKGKRVAWIVGVPSMNMLMEANLAFAGLTWDDVQKVEFSGYPASMRGLIAGQADVASMSNNAPLAFELSASPRGLKWLPLPHEDKGGWDRATAVCSFIAPTIIDEGAGMDGKDVKPVEAVNYPCPIMLTLKDQHEDSAYWMTRMIAEAAPAVKNSMASGPYWQIDAMLKSRFVVPFHEGSVRYFKEVGKWTPELEERQQYLVKRQEVLSKAYAEAKKAFEAQGKPENSFPDFWLAARSDALEKVGMGKY